MPTRGSCRENRGPGKLREWRRSRINRAAHDLPPGWVGRPHSQRHSLPQRPSPTQPGGGRHTYVAKRGGRASGAHIQPKGMTVGCRSTISKARNAL
jgi:hypothetical protein